MIGEKISKEEFIAEYLKGTTDSELAEIFDTSVRTVGRKLKELRDNNEIPYRALIENNDITNNRISEFELLKLLALYETKAKVAKLLNLPISTITNYCKTYNIEDNKTKSERLNKTLKELTSGYKPAKIDKHLKVDGESLIIDIGDWHLGKLVRDETGNYLYNVEIANNRISKLIEGMLKLLDSHLVKHIKVEEAIIICGGDMANGEGIYPTQVYDQSDAPPKQVMFCVELIMKLVLALLDRSLPVKFYGVKGNHGRLGKDSDPASNWDLMIYMILKHISKIQKLDSFYVEYTEADYLPITVRNKWRYLIRHEGFLQDETSAGRAKYLGWMKEHKADLIVSHHFHHWSVNDRKIINGSPVGRDDLSERMAVSDGEPSQLLWVATDERSHTNFYPVDLKSKEE
jgi:hypothetical protein